MDVGWLEHKGRKILSVDYRGARDRDEMLGILRREMDFLKSAAALDWLAADGED